jgi:hypothetical protein
MLSSSCCIKTETLASARLLQTLLLLVMLSLAWPSRAADWRDALPQARLIGSGELSWFGFRIYRASLWSNQSGFDPGQPFALELTYQRHISRQRLVDVSIKEMRRLTGERYSEAQFQRWEADMQHAFIDVQDGDQLIATFVPGMGCRFYNRHGLLAEVRDQEFAQAFFAIWLDPRSKDEQLRKRLTGAAG